MKKLIYSLGVSSLLLAGTIFSGCNSPSNRTEEAKEDVNDAQQELNEAREDEIQQQMSATPEEWAVYKTETELKIKENEVRIAELELKMTKPGVTPDSLRRNRINALVEKNNDLKAKLRDYESNRSDWESFKREFNHDMDELGKAIKDVTVDNKK